MAINEIAEYSHLTAEDIENIGRELDAIQADIQAKRGIEDTQYIYRILKVHHALELTGRLALIFPRKKPLFWLGAVSLGIAKIIDNMELGHNIMHGQWDWMHDKEIHSSRWEWDNANFAQHWKHTHNYIHHKYTNIVDVDDDIGYGVIRVTRDQPWRLFHIFNLVNNLVLQLVFEYGVAAQHLNLIETMDGLYPKEDLIPKAKDAIKKISRQVIKDYIAFPLLAGKGFRQAVYANIIANIIRNVWSNMVIFCGHFPDGAEKFNVEDLKTETRAEWYLRQMLGSANFTGGKLMDIMSGNLNHQIEHHIFPDLPSNRYAEIAEKVQDICRRYDLPYSTGSLLRQYFKAWRTIAKLSLPNRFLWRTTHDAPETSSELRFYTENYEPPATITSYNPRGLSSALNQQKFGLKNIFSRSQIRSAV